MPVETRGKAAVAWHPGISHRYYEDRYRLLPKEVSLVQKQTRGELFAVFDGISGAPKGREAAQKMSDCLVRFYQEPDCFEGSPQGVHRLLMETNLTIFTWGMISGTNTPLGGCAGTIAWLHEGLLYIFHAGDTLAILIRDGQTTQLTQIHEHNNIMLRYFGLGPELEMEVVNCTLEPFDRILLISDGVTRVHSVSEAAQVIDSFEDNCRAVEELARRSKVLGAPDDITVLLIEVEEDD